MHLIPGIALRTSTHSLRMACRWHTNPSSHSPHSRRAAEAATCDRILRRWTVVEWSEVSNNLCQWGGWVAAIAPMRRPARPYDLLKPVMVMVDCRIAGSSDAILVNTCGVYTMSLQISSERISRLYFS